MKICISRAMNTTRIYTMKQNRTLQHKEEGNTIKYIYTQKNVYHYSLIWNKNIKETKRCKYKNQEALGFLECDALGFKEGAALGSNDCVALEFSIFTSIDIEISVKLLNQWRFKAESENQYERERHFKGC